MIDTIRIGNKSLGPNDPPLIIAEMSGNHNQSLDRALAIVEASAKAGAHALKIQTYTADTMTLNVRQKEFVIDNPASLWKGYCLYDLYQKAFTPWEWHKTIFDRARELGMVGFSTPFDRTAVDFLEKLDVPLYKIASFENIDIPLIRYVAQTRKPLIISTGMATALEIQEAVEAARQNGCTELVLLKCTSAYPAPAAESHLKTIPELRDRFDCLVGLSDHTLGNAVSIASVALGACVIERHVTLSREEGGVDAAFSLEPHELNDLVNSSKAAWEALGNIHFGPTDTEVSSLVFRRSLYVAKKVRQGESFTEDNVRAVRPGYGLPPKHFDTVIGKKANQDLEEGTALTWEMIS